MTAVLDKDEGRSESNMGQEKDKWHTVCLPFFSPWLHPKTVSTERAWLLPYVKFSFTSDQEESFTRDDPFIAQVQFSEAS